MINIEGFKTFFMPIVRLSDAQITGFEALLRGKHPIEEIVDKAQKTGAIIDLDRWSIKNAIKDISGLKKDQKLFINCHPKSLRLAAEIISLDIFTNANIAPNQVVLEITEQEQVDKELFAFHKNKLNNIGIDIAIDDFGKNTTSVDYLLDLNPDIVKLDQSLINNIFKDSTKEIISQIVQLQEKKYFKVIAEGIETLTHKSAYELMGIKYGQGWLFGKPDPVIPKETFANNR